MTSTEFEATGRSLSLRARHPRGDESIRHHRKRFKSIQLIPSTEDQSRPYREMLFKPGRHQPVHQRQ